MGGALQLHEDRDRVALPGELFGEPSVAEEAADLRLALGGAADRLDAAAQHAELLLGDGLDAQVDRGADRDRRAAAGGHVQHGHQRVVRILHAFHGRHVRAGRDDRTRLGDQCGHPAAGHGAHGSVALVRTDVEQRGSGGQELALVGEDFGHLARDRALQCVTALGMGEDAGCAQLGGHGAGEGPEARGGHDDDRDGQYEPPLRACESYGQIEFFGRLQLGKRLLAKLHGLFLQLHSNGVGRAGSREPRSRGGRSGVHWHIPLRDRRYRCSPKHR